MIEKERLEELIEQEETVWCVSELWGINKLKLHNKDVRDSDCFHISKTLLLSDSIEFYDEEETYKVPFQLLFETEQEYLKHQEEAEFIKKYHTTRVERFDPPIWEDFVEMEEWCFWKKNHRQTVIRILGTKYIAVETSYERFFTGDLTKENYIKAVEKAYNLFKGEEK